MNKQLRRGIQEMKITSDLYSYCHLRKELPPHSIAKVSTITLKLQRTPLQYETQTLIHKRYPGQPQSDVTRRNW